MTIATHSSHILQIRPTEVIDESECVGGVAGSGEFKVISTGIMYDRHRCFLDTTLGGGGRTSAMTSVH